MIGASLNQYRITASIGAGGMGEVFRARDTRLNRDVAVKVLWLSLWCSLVTPILAASSSDFLPPVQPWRGGSEALVAKADDPWITPSEKTGLTETPGYDETIAYLNRLDAASRLISLKEFGRSAQGRALYVAIAAKGRAFSPDAVRKSGRPTLLVQAGIHSGEIDGKDAGLMLLRDIALRGKASLLDRANFLFVPVFNADGHERSSEWNRPNQRGPVRQGWRTTAQNLNLNRDYMKADSPEMQSMLALINQWSPALYLDLHVSDGIDHQYDITFCFNGDSGGFAWSPQIANWLSHIFRPATEAALKTAGHVPGQFFERSDEVDMAKGFSIGPFMPRFSNGYGDLRHVPTVLVENHSLKPYRQRVLGTYVLLESSLRTLGSHGKALQQAVAADASAVRTVLPLNRGIAGGEQTTTDYLGVTHETYVSPATGTNEIRWLGAPEWCLFASISPDGQFVTIATWEQFYSIMVTEDLPTQLMRILPFP